MKEISIEESKKIQIEILNDIDTFCRRNNLKYSLAYGTLIGAVRHKGFIPWDDDIDIIMPRQDYDKFMREYRNPIYKVLNYQTDARCHTVFAEVYDDRTYLIHGRHILGVFVDIFSIDGFPVDSQLESYCAEFIKKQKAVVRKRSIYKNSKEKIKEYASYIIRNILYPRKRSTYIAEFESLYSSHKIDDSPNSGYVEYGCDWHKEVMPSYIFKDYIELPFEGKNYMCIRHYHEYLSRIYGDYMQLPPEDQRVGHHAFKTYWK